MSFGVSFGHRLNLREKLSKNLKHKTENLTSEIKEEFQKLEEKFDEYAGKRGINLRTPLGSTSEAAFAQHLKAVTSLAKRVSYLNNIVKPGKEALTYPDENNPTPEFPLRIKTNLGDRLEKLRIKAGKSVHNLPGYDAGNGEKFSQLLQERAEKLERKYDNTLEKPAGRTEKTIMPDIPVTPAAPPAVTGSLTGNPAVTEEEQYGISLELDLPPTFAGQVTVPYFSVRKNHRDIVHLIINDVLKLAGELVKNSELLFRNGKIKTDEAAEIIINKFAKTATPENIRKTTAGIIEAALDDIVRGTGSTEETVKELTEKTTEVAGEVMNLIISLMSKTPEIQMELIRNIK